MKKYHILTIFLALALFCEAQSPCWDGSVAEAYEGGNGSVKNPYQIATAEQLALLAQQTNDGTGGDAYYILTNDIDLAGCSGEDIEWTSIGRTVVTEVDTTFRYFTGHFDGNGKTVSNLYQHQNEYFKGLFGCTNGAVIKNVNLVSVDIDNESEYAGALVAYAGVTDIIDCNVSESSVKTTTGIAGGIIGFAGVPFGEEGYIEEFSKISSCYISNVNVEGDDSGGGIAGRINAYGVDGYNSNGYAHYTITDCGNDESCHVRGEIKAGGIVGFISYVTIENCVNNCLVEGNGFVGGICGMGRYYDVGIINCLNNFVGTFTTNNGVGGGIVGLATAIEIVGCRNKAVGYAYRCGGIAGRAGSCRIKSCVNEGSFVEAFGICGGIIGEMSGDVMSNCINYGDMSGIGMIGGLVGQMGYSSICGSVNKGNITGIMSDTLYIGGLVGVSFGDIASSYNTGNVSVVNTENRGCSFGVGGIVGVVLSTGHVYNVYNTGSVINPDNIQGVVPNYGNIVGYGYQASGNYLNCYWLDDDALPANGNDNAPAMIGSSAFHQGVTLTSWMLDEPQYDTYDMVEALNYGSETIMNTYAFHDMPYISVWSEDVNGDNNGYPVVVSYPKYPLLGSEWYYGMTDMYGNSTYQYLSCDDDTIINHKKVKIIVTTNTLYDKSSGISREYIREDNGCVYWWHDPTQDSTMLYNFTANVGDQWSIKIGNDSITMHVDEVGIVEYNGQAFRSLNISDANNIFSGTIVCSVGHVKSFFPEQMLNKNSRYKVDGIRCYWEKGTIIYQEGNDDCDAIYGQLHNGFEDPSADNEVDVYPNPSNGILFVKSDNINTDYQIINILGEIVLSGEIVSENQQIDISDLLNGIYIIRINGNTTKIIINK